MDLPHLPSQVGFGSCLIEVKIIFQLISALVAPLQQSVSMRGVMSRRQAGGDEIDAMCCVRDRGRESRSFCSQCRAMCPAAR